MASHPHSQLANIPVVAAQSAHMVHTFRAWPQAYWSRPAFCPGWSAADAVAHLASGGEFYAQVISAGRSGTPQLPWGASTATEFREARQAAVRQLIDAGPAALIEGFARSAARLQEVLESLQEADLAKAAWHPRGLIPIGSWIGMRLIELGAHDWDIRQPHEAQAYLSPTVLPALVGVLPDLHAQFLHQRLSGGLDGVYTLCADEVAWGFTVHDKTVTSHANAPEASHTCLSADAESMVLLSLGRADMEAKIQSGALALRGDSAKGRQLCAILFRAF